MTVPPSSSRRHLDRYRSRWPDVFVGLEEWQARAIVQRLENAALEGIRPTEADARYLIEVHASITDPNTYIRRVMLFPLRPGPE